MKFHILAVVLLGFLALTIKAEPKPEPAKGRRASFVPNPRLRAAASDDNINQMVAKFDIDDSVDEKDLIEESVPDKSDNSQGRLFFRKFLLFRNLFSNSDSQPVIPIIITGASTGSTSSSSTPITITSTGELPTAQGTITTEPVARGSDVQEDDDDDEGSPEQSMALNEQALQAALSAGSQEYIVTDEEVKGTTDGKTSKQPSRINLKRKGDKQNQFISVRIPPQYRRYFKNGQKVMLNTGNGPTRRRVIRRRLNRNNRKRVINNNSNKRTRNVAA